MEKLLPVVFVWDFDGVVVFTPHYEAWKQACEKYGINGFTREFYDEHVSGRPRVEGGLAILELLGGYSREYLLGDKGRRVLQEFLEYKNNVFRRLVEEKVFQVNMDAVKYIEEARRMGVLQVLASASRNAKLIAEHARLPDGRLLVELFDVNVSGSATTKIAVFENALREIESRVKGVKRECIIVYEDSPSGIKAARKLGFKTIGYRLPPHVDPVKLGVNLVVDNFSNLHPLDAIRAVGCMP